jgi:L-lactate dehydrogenase
MKTKSIGIIGMGWVGSSVAISLLHAGVAGKLLLHDIREGIAEGEAMDLNHGSSFYPSCAVRSVGISEMKSCDVIVVTAGRGGRPEETRLQLLEENIKIARHISDELKGFIGILIVVANPVDVLTYYYQKFTGLPAGRVIGTGTMLDTARLREMIAQRLHLDAKSIHAQVVGEHGDSEVVLWSLASVGGVSLRKWKGWNSSMENEIGEQVRKAAQEIIKRKGATNHAIGLVTATLIKWFIRGERRIVNISTLMNGQHGLQDVALSLPTIISAEGAVEVLELELNPEEADGLQQSADVLKAAIANVGTTL